MDMLRASWVYSLKQEELVAHLKEFQLDQTGSVEKLKKRLAKFIGEEHDELQTKRIFEIQTKQEAKGSQLSPKFLLPSDPSTFFESPVKDKNSNVTQPTIEANTTESKMEIIDKLRKWGISFDGTGDPLEFIERSEELSLMYGVTVDLLPQLMPELLRDRALIWFRNNNNSWSSWNNFKIDLSKFFLPPRYFEKLEDEIQNCKQRRNENFKDYLLSIQNLMRHCKWTDSQKLEIIYMNCLPDYQWYIKKKYFSSLQELATLAEDLESFRSRSDKNNVSSYSSIKAATSVNQTALRCEEFRITATVIIGKTLITSTIDTGATRNFIKTDFLKRFKGNLRKANENLEVILADGTRKEITESVKFNVTFGNKKKSCTFFVLTDFFEEMILGLDFLRTFNTTLNCSGLSLNCEFQNTPTEPTNQQDETKNKEPTSVVITQQGSGQLHTVFELSPDRKKIIRDFLETKLPELKKLLAPMPKSYESRLPRKNTVDVPLCPIPIHSLVHPTSPKRYLPTLPSPQLSLQASPTSSSTSSPSWASSATSTMLTTSPAIPLSSPALHHTPLPSPTTLMIPEPAELYMDQAKIPNTIMNCIHEALKRRRPNERIKFLKTEGGVKYQIRVARSGSYCVKLIKS